MKYLHSEVAKKIQKNNIKDMDIKYLKSLK